MTNNKYVPVELPKTETISYFNETEWNEGLTSKEIEKNNEIAELQYQDNLLHGPKVGPGNSQSSNSGPGGGGGYGYPDGHPKWGSSSIEETIARLLKL
jgi:hypothetical protein